jgi:hypothetical protein
MRSNFGQAGARRNFAWQGGSNDVIERFSVPTGYNGRSWILPHKAGAVSAINKFDSIGTLTATGAQGVNGTLTSTDSIGTLAATGALVVTGSATINCTCTVTGSAYAALVGSTTQADALGTITGTATALGWMTCTLAGNGSLSVVSYATGALSATIAPATDLTAGIFSSYLLDNEDVESGLTLRKALRLIAAATAGKVSGAAGSTVTIRNAVADGKDRIVATVDSNGNRTAITYDLS